MSEAICPGTPKAWDLHTTFTSSLFLARADSVEGYMENIMGQLEAADARHAQILEELAIMADQILQMVLRWAAKANALSRARTEPRSRSPPCSKTARVPSWKSSSSASAEAPDVVRAGTSSTGGWRACWCMIVVTGERKLSSLGFPCRPRRRPEQL